MKSAARIGITLLCAVVVTGLAGAPAHAQCDPPGMNVKCWDGGGDGFRWSDPFNWNGPSGHQDEVPQAGDAVYHLTGDAIEMDMANVEIASFTFDPSGSLAIDPFAQMTVGADFTSMFGPGSGQYSLNVGAGATLDIGGDMTLVDVTLPQATAQNGTVVTVDGTIGAGNWSIGKLTSLGQAQFGGVDLTAFPGNVWTIEGSVTMAVGFILGAGDWTIDGTGQGGATLQVGSGPYSFEALTLIGDADDAIMFAQGFSNLTIGQDLHVDDGQLILDAGQFVAEAGSTVTLENGSLVDLGALDPTSVPTQIGSLAYGAPGSPTSVFTARGGLVLRDADSSVINLPGSGGGGNAGG